MLCVRSFLFSRKSVGCRGSPAYYISCFCCVCMKAVISCKFANLPCLIRKGQETRWRKKTKRDAWSMDDEYTNKYTHEGKHTRTCFIHLSVQVCVPSETRRQTNSNFVCRPLGTGVPYRYSSINQATSTCRSPRWYSGNLERFQ